MMSKYIECKGNARAGSVGRMRGRGEILERKRKFTEIYVVRKIYIFFFK